MALVLVMYRALFCLLLMAPLARATPTCERLAQTSLAPDGETTRWVATLWESLIAAQARLDSPTPRPSLKLLAGPGLEAGAWFCQSESTVYVSMALVDYAWAGRGSDGSELLAFALAHELAHARFDRTDRQLVGRCPDQDTALEARADRRAAFLVALARGPEGRRLDPAILIRRDALRALFTSELGWPSDCPALRSRLAAVEVALARMSELAEVFDIAVRLSIVGSEPATRLLAAIQEVAGRTNAADGGWDALPELGLLRATVHMKRAAISGWCPPSLRDQRLDPDPCTLACPMIVPGRSRLAPDLQGDRRRETIDAATERLIARLMLDLARLQGVPETELSGLEACHAYLCAEPERAMLALRSLGPPSNARVRAAVRDMESLFSLQRALLKDPPTATPTTTWLERMAVLRERLPANGNIAVHTLDRWLQKAGPSRSAPSLLPRLELQPCIDASKARPATFGEVVLRRAKGCALIETPRGGLAMRDTTPQATLPPLMNWSAVCRLDGSSVTQEGLELLGASCEGDTRWVLELEGGAVKRATSIEELQ